MGHGLPGHPRTTRKGHMSVCAFYFNLRLTTVKTEDMDNVKTNFNVCQADSSVILTCENVAAVN